MSLSKRVAHTQAFSDCTRETVAPGAAWWRDGLWCSACGSDSSAASEKRPCVPDASLAAADSGGAACDGAATSAGGLGAADDAAVAAAESAGALTLGVADNTCKQE
jgi:hypothetical protein